MLVFSIDSNSRRTVVVIDDVCSSSQCTRLLLLHTQLYKREEKTGKIDEATTT